MTYLYLPCDASGNFIENAPTLTDIDLQRQRLQSLQKDFEMKLSH